MNQLIDFFSFQDPNIRFATLGIILLTSSSAIVGTFAFLRKKALVGDAIAHSILPGICVAFLLSGTKNPIYLIIGAFTTGWISVYLIDFISSKSKIKEDTSIALILSVFFGVGIFLLTIIQHGGGAEQSGLNHFLFGKAASLVQSDVLVFGVTSLMLLSIVFIFFKELMLISFDPSFAQTIGMPVKHLEILLTAITVLAIVTGIQAVGVVLMAAILITPAAAARFWTNRIKVMLALAAIFGALSGLIGSLISYLAPAMPTGPWIVMAISFIAFASFLFSPQRGIAFRIIAKKYNQNIILQENILKTFFQVGEEQSQFLTPRTEQELLKKREFKATKLRRGIKQLVKEGFLTHENTALKLTEAGFQKGRRILKRHRLWELYLTKIMHIAPDHVHEDAEAIEHVITPELERRLESNLNFPVRDPHDSQIPYRK